MDATSFRRDAVEIYHRVRADPLVGTPGLGIRRYNASGKSRAYWRQEQIVVDCALLGRGFVLGRIDTLGDRAYSETHSGIMARHRWLD